MPNVAQELHNLYRQKQTLSPSSAAEQLEGYLRSRSYNMDDVNIIAT